MLLSGILYTANQIKEITEKIESSATTVPSDKSSEAETAKTARNTLRSVENSIISIENQLEAMKLYVAAGLKASDLKANNHNR